MDKKGYPDWLDDETRDAAPNPYRIAAPSDPPDPRAPRSRPQIVGHMRDVADMVDDAWDALADRDPDHKSVYRQAGRPVRLVAQGTGMAPSIDGIPSADMRLRLAQAARWVKITRDGSVPIPPPDYVSSAMAVGSPPLRVPELDSVASAPILSADGDICREKGYNKKTMTWISGKLAVPEIDEHPSRGELDRAVVLIREAVVDFPFVSRSDLTHWVALALTPFVRQMIDGPVPMYVVVAPKHKSGKTLCVDLAHTIWAGRTLTPVALPPSGEERVKWLTAIVRAAPSHIFLDNLSDKKALDIPELAAALTSARWQGRLLGTSSMVDLACRSIWVATGNNPRMSAELVRRCCWIRLRDEPTRDAFQHPELLQWARGERSRLVWAFLTLAKSWISAGRKRGVAQLGSFESWSAVVGGVLEHGGFCDFLSEREEIEADRSVDDEIEAFCHVWHERHGGAPVACKILVKTCLANELLIDVIGDRGELSQSQKLGRLLKRITGGVYGPYRVYGVRNPDTKAHMYGLKEAPVIPRQNNPASA